MWKALSNQIGPAKHAKTRGTRDRTACKFCGKAFTTFSGVRLHERSSHRALYQRELEDKLAVPDAIVFTTMAEIEAGAPKGKPFIEEMVNATGLTRDQIRHRRAKDDYKQSLEIARSNRRRKSLAGTLSHAFIRPKMPTPSAVSTPPSIGEPRARPSPPPSSSADDPPPS